MCPALHEDNHKLTIVKSPVEAMDSVNKVIREKGYNIEDKNVRILSSSKGEEELFDIGAFYHKSSSCCCSCSGHLQENS